MSLSASTGIQDSLYDISKINTNLTSLKNRISDVNVKYGLFVADPVSFSSKDDEYFVTLERLASQLQNQTSTYIKT
jgi:hypothetical protein